MSDEQQTDGREGEGLRDLEAALEADLERTEQGSNQDADSSAESPETANSDASAPQADPLTIARNESKENYDKYLRMAAELDNVKRRAVKERSDLLKYSGEAMARDLLDVLDNLERAIVSAASGAGSGEEFIAGVKMIAEQFRQTFDRHGIRGESAIGQQFDPAKQEALASVPMDDKPAGEVIEEFRKTYFFKDKLLRTGQVVVAAVKQ
jgi:molecular chaperone GrpE